MKTLFSLYFRLKGWKIEGGIPKDFKKCVLLAAPHTSNWDFIFGLGALRLFGVDVKYLAKKELFKFPFESIFKSLGGIPVDRTKSNSMVNAMIELIKQRDELVVLIPPEGTRKRVQRWKSGFYNVAMGAQVPIALGYLDYKRKVAGIGPAFMPSGDKEKDFEYITGFYKQITAKFPEQFNPYVGG
jgi:1-acyl-sn-glycerol-3-phosphate acyltransferase